MNRSILAELIRNNKRLIIPNLGAFLHRETESTAHPGITFSPFLKYNDGQLEELLVNHYSFTKIDALEQVKNLSSEIIDEIKDNGAYVIRGIGSLAMDSKGSIHLTSTEETNIPNPHIDKGIISSQKSEAKAAEVVFGSEDVNKNIEKSPNVSQSESDTKNVPSTDDYTGMVTAEKRDNTNTDSKAAPDQSSTADGIESSKQAKSTKVTMKKSKREGGHRSSTVRMLVFIAISLVIIITFAFIIRELAFAPDDADWESIQSKPERIEPIKLPPDFSSKNDEFDKKFEATDPDKENEVSESAGQQATETTEEVIEKTLTQSKPAKVSTPTYSLVVGSFSEKANAQKLVNELKANGFEAEVYSRTNGKFLAVIGQYNTKDEANQQKDKLKNQFQGIWIISR